MANLYTKGGDKGQTSLIGGSRVSKGDLRVECYGTLDELGAALGLAYSLCTHPFVRRRVRSIQARLFSYSAELAADQRGLVRLQGKLVEDRDVAELEKVVDWCTLVNGAQTHFVIPGEEPCSAALHLARTVSRRGERHIVRLGETRPLRREAREYINRLSDAIYALARLEETYRQLSPQEAQVTDAVLDALWDKLD